MKTYLKNNYKTILLCLLFIGICLAVYFINTDKITTDNSGSISDKSYVRKEKYGINEVEPIYISEEDLVKIYLADYVNLIYTDIEKAYSLIDSSDLEYNFTSLDIFEAFIERRKNEAFARARVKKFAVSTYQGAKAYYVIDENLNTFVFIQSGIMDYKVKIQ